MQIKETSLEQRLTAWSVHLFTVSGILFAFLSLLAIEHRNWELAMIYMVINLFVDGVDGALARAAEVKKVLPNINGQTFDYLIDYTTYAVVPAWFFYHAGLFPEDWNLWLCFYILIVSTIYYGKEGMVSDDFYFIGFPVLWNVVVFCLFFVFEFTPLVNGLLVIVLGILHFLPVRFAYPSRGDRLKWLTLGMTAVGFAGMALVLWNYPVKSPPGILAVSISLFFFGSRAIWDTLFRK